MAAGFQVLGQAGGPFGPADGGVAGGFLIGAGLVGQQHQQVPVKQTEQGPPDHVRPDGQGLSLLQPLDVQGEDLHLSISRRRQPLADEAGEVGPPAGVPRRGHEQADPVQIIGATVQGVQILAQGEDEGVAHVVVGPAEAQILNPPAVFQNDGVVFRGVKGVLEEGEVIVQHGGDEEDSLAGDGGIGDLNHGWPPF